VMNPIPRTRRNRIIVVWLPVTGPILGTTPRAENQAAHGEYRMGFYYLSAAAFHRGLPAPRDGARITPS
jgi:hypothetical protein